MFFFLINTFIQQGHNKLIESDSKYIYTVTKDFVNTFSSFNSSNNLERKKTLKTGVMMLLITGINDILPYTKIENNYL